MYTEDLRLNETSVEELNLIANPTSTMQIDDTANNASARSSSLALALVNSEVEQTKLNVIN